MRTKFVLLAVLTGLVIPVIPTYGQNHTKDLNDKVVMWAEHSEQMLPPQTKGVLNRLAYAISEEYERNSGLDLLLVDRDNSYISQLAEVWMNIAVELYGLDHVRIHSAGFDVGVINMEAISTFEDWWFSVKKDRINPDNMVKVDYNTGHRVLFAKGVDPTETDALVLYVDQYCGEKFLGDRLQGMKALRFELGPSADCIEDGRVDYDRLNREIGSKVLFLVRQIRLNQAQKLKTKKSRLQ